MNVTLLVVNCSDTSKGKMIKINDRNIINEFQY